MSIREELKQRFGPVSFADDRITGTLRFDENFPGFAGHFPEQPVVPGVCLLEALMALVELATGKRHEIAGIRQLKFFRPLLPGDELEITLTLEERLCRGQGELNGGKVLKAVVELEEL